MGPDRGNAQAVLGPLARPGVWCSRWAADHRRRLSTPSLTSAPLPRTPAGRFTIHRGRWNTKPTPDPASVPGGRAAMASEARMAVAGAGRLGRTAPDLRDLWTVQATRAGSGLRKRAGRYDALAMR